MKNVEDGGAVTITMVPRIRKRHVGNNKVKYVRDVVILFDCILESQYLLFWRKFGLVCELTAHSGQCV